MRPTVGFAQPQNNFKFGIPHQNIQNQTPNYDANVSMRTARPLRQNMLEASFENEDQIFYNNEVEVSPGDHEQQNFTYLDDNYAYNSNMSNIQPQSPVQTHKINYHETRASGARNSPYGNLKHTVVCGQILS